MSDFLNNLFRGYDYAILSFLHNLASNAKGFFTPFATIISFITEKGLIFIVLAIILMLFKKTRKIGICMFGAVGCGAIITNFVLKDLIARPRPFIDQTSDFYTWWQFIGAPNESEFSFPSGHTTGVMAAMMSLFLFLPKKKSWLAFIPVILVGFSRNYLMVHYPSDVLGGIIVGALAGIIAYLITNLIYKFLESHQSVKICKFILNFNLLKNK